MRQIILVGIVTLFLLTIGCSLSKPKQTLTTADTDNKELVVLLHGLGRSTAAMWRVASRLEAAGYYVQRIGYGSLTRTPDEILADISAQIDACCAHYDQPIHFVGHSLGGLLTRAYLQSHDVKNLGRVVLMGTPNQGTELVDKFRDKWWMQIAGPTALALGTDENSFPNSLKDPYYPVGIIAGIREPDRDDTIIPGKDDGLVSVDSTKLKNGMTDFIVLPTGHSSMRYSEAVCTQAIEFLQYGRFDHRAITY